MISAILKVGRSPMSDGYGNDWDGLPLFGGDTPPFKPGATRKEQIQDMVGFVKPSCGQLAKQYRRKLYSTMVLALVFIYRKQYRAGIDWIHFREIYTWRGIYVGGDMNKLPHWGLIEQKGNEDQTKRRSGFWRMTQKGIDFVEGKLEIMSHIVLYDNKLVRMEGSYIGIKEALGERFDYQELMRG